MAGPIEKDGVVLRRKGTKFLWMRYRDLDSISRKQLVKAVANYFRFRLGRIRILP